ncbi:protein of unknown function [Streptomyces sp. KY75]|nr:protein of unknown function [Streptomyces sp. KY70]CAD5975593.1 protein of unknown function [Streptomyces sp. KY75]
MRDPAPDGGGFGGPGGRERRGGRGRPGGGERRGGAAPAGEGGSGLAGLRERLAALGGSLEAGAAGDGLFRVTATVPLTAPRNRSDALHNRSGSASPDER